MPSLRSSRFMQVSFQIKNRVDRGSPKYAWIIKDGAVKSGYLYILSLNYRIYRQSWSIIMGLTAKDCILYVFTRNQRTLKDHDSSWTFLLVFREVFRKSMRGGLNERGQ